MRLRSLELKDANLMLEWMHDDSVVHHLQSNFIEKTIDDCIAFINSAGVTEKNLHLAIVDDNDEYMGTVSLKNISDNMAEFAITLRTVAMGGGYSKYGMERILEKGFDDLHLREIYWCVSPNNNRAVHFYEKCGYSHTDPMIIRGDLGYNKEQISNYIWYSISYDEFNKRKSKYAK